MSEKVIMPKELTAENGAKYLFSGEFYTESIVLCSGCDGQGAVGLGEDYMECSECNGEGFLPTKTPISWTIIKEIYAKSVRHLGEPVEGS